MAKHGLKTYLSIPLAMSLFFLSGQVAADEVTTSTNTTPAPTEGTTTAASQEDVSTTTETTVASEKTEETPVTTPSSETPVAEVEVPAQPTATATQVAPAAYEVVLTDVPTEIGKVFVPTWSDAGGQNDLVWYEAKKREDSRYAVTIDLGKHHYNDGRYQVHSYGQHKETGQLVWLDNTEFTANHNHTVTAEQTATGLAINIKSDGMTDYSKVRFAVWSSDQGQDDLRWYSADAQGRALASYSNHRGLGKYHVHAYLEDGGYHWLGHQDTQLAAPQVQSEVTKLTDTKYQVKLTNVPAYIREVKAPTWSDNGGQNDINWYTMDRQGDNTYLLTLDLANHNFDAGFYHIHLYGRTSLSDGGLVFLGHNHLTATIKHGVTVDQTTEGLSLNFSSNTVTDYSKVRFAVWSSERGQDDLRWYSADAQGRALAAYNNHVGTGLYHVHTYLQNGSNFQFLGFADTTISAPTGRTEITKLTDTKYQIKVSDVPLYVTEVVVPTWSEKNGQDDIQWYVAEKQDATTYLLTIELSKHRYDTGFYHAHIYGRSRLAQNSLVWLTASEGFTVVDETVTDYRSRSSASQGDYQVINRKIFLDAGHGGKDPGAVYFGQHEKALNLTMQELVKSSLEREGYEVITSRDDDRFVELLERSRLVNQTLSDLFLSIHFNAATNADARGIETYYYAYNPDYPARINPNFHNDAERLSRSAYLAQAIHQEMLGQTGAVDNGVRRETFSVLRETTAPAVLVELGYMSNREDFKKIVEPAYQAKLADGIVKGVLNYYRRYS